MERGAIEIALLVGAVFLLLGVVASKISSRIGVPALVLFIGIGMLSGSEGPGGIVFENFQLTKEIGLILLAFIAFAGGLDTEWEEIKPIVGSGIVLATLGVAATAGLVGAFAHVFLGLSLLEGLLLGAIVSSTDAAAIFSVLRGANISLKYRLRSLLEFESGANDPLAVILTIGLTSLIGEPNASVGGLVLRLLQQMSFGLALGYAFGLGAVWLINRVRLEYDGLYTVLTIALVATTYGTAHMVGGSEFLAVYVAGLTMGSRNFLHKISLIQFHDGIAWLFQITVFLALGLLVFPSQLLAAIGMGTVVALFMIFIARPVAVFAALPFSGIPKRARMFVAWAGLRGAFPIVLGTLPILAGVQSGHVIFNVVFFVVLFSVLVQGTTLRYVGRLLGVVEVRAPEDLQPAQHSELLEVELGPDSPSAGRQVIELGLPKTALIVLLKRDSQAYIPRGGTVLKAGDKLLVATRREDHDELRTRIEGKEG